MKKLLNHIFIDGLSGMALGLFSTLIVGTIIQQIGNLIGGNIGDMLFIMGKMAAAMTGAGGAFCGNGRHDRRICKQDSGRFTSG